jgi:hypothetical protein
VLVCGRSGSAGPRPCRLQKRHGVDGQFVTATAKCSRGKRATGGGFLAPHDFVNTSFYVYDSQKVGQRSWRASAQFFTYGISGTLTTFAYCSKDGPKTKAKAVSMTTPAGANLFPVDAKCSSGKAQAGGFLIPTPNPLTDSFRNGSKTWRTRVYSGSAGQTITSYVYCAKAEAPQARSGNATSPGTFEAARATSSPCKHGDKPLTGGFSQPDATSTNYIATPSESLRIGKQWRASAFLIGTVSPTFTATAYCG